MIGVTGGAIGGDNHRPPPADFVKSGQLRIQGIAKNKSIYQLVPCTLILPGTGEVVLYSHPLDRPHVSGDISSVILEPWEIHTHPTGGSSVILEPWEIHTHLTGGRL